MEAVDIDQYTGRPRDLGNGFTHTRTVTEISVYGGARSRPFHAADLIAHNNIPLVNLEGEIARGHPQEIHGLTLTVGLQEKGNPAANLRLRKVMHRKDRLHPTYKLVDTKVPEEPVVVGRVTLASANKRDALVDMLVHVLRAPEPGKRSSLRLPEVGSIDRNAANYLRTRARSQ